MQSKDIDSLTCFECGQTFKNKRGLHTHLKKHNLSTKDYYIKHVAKRSKFSNKLLPFESFSSYVDKDFLNEDELRSWCSTKDKEEVRNYIGRFLKDKNGFGYFHLDLKNRFAPTIDHYKRAFGSYSAACKQVLNLEPIFDKNLPKDFFDKGIPKDFEIFEDTREQQPLCFGDIKSHRMKLEVGDYCASGKYYNYAFVDRKSENDIQGTLGPSNLDRFKRELDRVVETDSYLFVVIESSLEEIDKKNKKFNRSEGAGYLIHQIRELTYSYTRRVQFVFTTDRGQSSFIIPRILFYGPQLMRVDLQYFLDKQLCG